MGPSDESSRDVFAIPCSSDNTAIKQSSLGLSNTVKRTRKREFLEALHDMPAFRDFAGLSHWDEYIPSESSILRFRHLLERHKLADQILATVNALLQAEGLQLKAGTVVDATLIAAPTSTLNEDKAQDSEMHQSK